MILIGARTGDTVLLFYIYLPYLLIIHFPFWVLLVFAVNEVLKRHFARVANITASWTATLVLLLLMTVCRLFVPADESLMLSIIEILCGLLSLNLTMSHDEKSKTKSVLQEWSFTDANVSRFLADLDKKKVSILFDSAYKIPSKRHIDSVWFRVYGWEDVRFYRNEVSDGGTLHNLTKVSIDIEHFEAFRWLQQVTASTDKLILEGISKESGFWIIYEFSKPNYKIVHPELYSNGRNSQ